MSSWATTSAGGFFHHLLSETFDLALDTETPRPLARSADPYLLTGQEEGLVGEVGS